MPDTLFEFAYNRTKAVEYAHRWAYSRNPDFYNFDNLGGDCTNFASQCLYAGSGVMNFTPTNGWYYIDLENRAPAWTGVEYLYNFLTGNQGVGPFGYEASIREVQPGDLVQLSFTKPYFEHTPVIVEVRTPVNMNNILVAAHTYDVDYKPLGSYRFRDVRYIHIDGVRNTI